MFGLLNIDKPVGWSSRDVVNRVERLVRPAKAGHAGTLDPLASGVLVVCMGPATRLIEYVQRMPKEYRATFLLGRSSASDDLETDVVELVDAPQPRLAEIEAALPRFVGTIQQRPPAYSALKVEGRRAYQLARRGDAPELAARPVDIYSLAVERYEYPELQLAIRCGGGAYVRSLGRDLAEACGTVAVMSALERTAVGGFRVEDALAGRLITQCDLSAHLLSPLAAAVDLPRVTLTADQVARAQRGDLFRVEEFGESSPGAGTPRLAAVDERGLLVALLKEARPGLLKPSPNFLQAE